MGTFTSPNLQTFAALLTGLVAVTGKRTVTGTCFVAVGLVVELPFYSHPVRLPIMASLWRPRTGPSKVELAASVIRLLTVRHHTRTLHVAADGAYHGKALPALHGNATFTTRLPANAVLYDLAPPPTGPRGRTVLKGGRMRLRILGIGLSMLTWKPEQTADHFRLPQNVLYVDAANWSVTDRHTGAEDKLAQIDVSITCRTSNVDLGIPAYRRHLQPGGNEKPADPWRTVSLSRMRTERRRRAMLGPDVGEHRGRAF